MVVCQTRIEISIDNQPDSIFILQQYRGSKAVDFDTSVYKNGVSVFESELLYPEGIYVLRNASNYPLTEVLIGKDRTFSLSVKDLNDFDTYSVVGAKETERYYKIIGKQRYISMSIMALESEIDSFPENVFKIDSLKKEFVDFERSMKMCRILKQM